MISRRACIRAAFVGALSLLLPSLGGCSHTGDNADARQTLVIGYDEYRPFIYVDDNGDVAGIDADIAYQACHRVGLEPVFEAINWENRDTYLERGDIDCLWSCYSMNDREADYAWVGPYMYSRQVVAVLSDSDIVTFDDLAGKRVAVKASTKPESIFLQQQGAPAIEGLYCLTDMNEVSAALRNKYVDAVAGHKVTLMWYLNSASVDYRILEGELLRAGLGVAFSRSGNSDVRTALAQALHEMRLDGTTASIMERYGLDPNLALAGVDDER